MGTRFSVRVSVGVCWWRWVVRFGTSASVPFCLVRCGPVPSVFYCRGDLTRRCVLSVFWCRYVLCRCPGVGVCSVGVLVSVNPGAGVFSVGVLVSVSTLSVYRCSVYWCRYSVLFSECVSMFCVLCLSVLLSWRVWVLMWVGRHEPVLVLLPGCLSKGLVCLCSFRKKSLRVSNCISTGISVYVVREQASGPDTTKNRPTENPPHPSRRAPGEPTSFGVGYRTQIQGCSHDAQIALPSSPAGNPVPWLGREEQVSRGRGLPPGRAQVVVGPRDRRRLAIAAEAARLLRRRLRGRAGLRLVLAPRGGSVLHVAEGPRRRRAGSASRPASGVGRARSVCRPRGPGSAAAGGP